MDVNCKSERIATALTSKRDYYLHRHEFIYINHPTDSFCMHNNIYILLTNYKKLMVFIIYLLKYFIKHFVYSCIIG